MQMEKVLIWMINKIMNILHLLGIKASHDIILDEKRDYLLKIKDDNFYYYISVPNSTFSEARNAAISELDTNLEEEDLLETNVPYVLKYNNKTVEII